jgi:MFS family permease
MDYHGQNLRERDFSGLLLAGADFSDSDIRGADFSDADLTGVQFSRSRGGIPPMWAAAVVTVALVIAAFVGILAALATAAMAQRVATGDSTDRVAVLVIAAVGLATITMATFRNFRQALVLGAVASMVVVAVAVPILVVRGEFSPRVTVTSMIWLAAIVGMFIVGAIARATAGIISPTAFLIVAVVGAATARSAGGALFAILISVAAVVLARRALANPEEVRLLHSGSHRFILSRTTSYRRANLTDANFRDAVTGPSDFSDATVTGATFEGASVTGRGKVTPKQLLEKARNDNESP